MGSWHSHLITVEPDLAYEEHDLDDDENLADDVGFSIRLAEVADKIRGDLPQQVNASNDDNQFHDAFQSLLRSMSDAQSVLVSSQIVSLPRNSI